jgi:uncharacterized Zn finger protein
MEKITIKCNECNYTEKINNIINIELIPCKKCGISINPDKPIKKN